MRGPRSWLILTVGALASAGCAPRARAVHIERPELIEKYLEETPDWPTLIVDLDDTVVAGTVLTIARLSSGIGYAGVPPFGGAAEALQRLRGDWNIVYVTARDDFLAARTLAWLERHGFPAAPAVFSTRLALRPEDSAAVKVVAIRELRQRGLSPTLGIGDRLADIAAYRAEGLDAIFVADGVEDEDFEKVLGVREDLSWDRSAPAVLSLTGASFDVYDTWYDVGRMTVEGSGAEER